MTKPKTKRARRKPVSAKSISDTLPPCRPRLDSRGRHPLVALVERADGVKVAELARRLRVAYPTAHEWVEAARKDKAFKLPAERVVLLADGEGALAGALAYALRPDLWNPGGRIAEPNGGA